MRPALETLKGKSNLVGAEIGVLGGDNAEDILKNLDIKKLYLIHNCSIYLFSVFI